jgi:hypothetical protein
MTFSFLIPADDNGAVTVKVYGCGSERGLYPPIHMMDFGWMAPVVDRYPWIVVAMGYTVCCSCFEQLSSEPHIHTHIYIYNSWPRA